MAGGGGRHEFYGYHDEQAMERCRSLDDRLRWMDCAFLVVGTVLHLIFVSWAYDNLWKSLHWSPPNDYTRLTCHEFWFVLGVELPLSLELLAPWRAYTQLPSFIAVLGWIQKPSLLVREGLPLYLPSPSSSASASVHGFSFARLHL